LRFVTRLPVLRRLVGCERRNEQTSGMQVPAVRDLVRYHVAQRPVARKECRLRHLHQRIQLLVQRERERERERVESREGIR
jgi:hypothetical protein